MLNIALAGLAATAVSADLLFPRQVPDGPCSTGVHVLAVGGGNGTDPFEYGRLETLAQSIVNAIPGSSMVSVPYNKVNIRNNPTAVPEGNQNLGQYVRDYNGACPNTKLVLVGYSAGAIISMNGLCTGIINPALADNTLIATVLYGDQTHIAGQPYNRGTCVGAADQNGRLADKRNLAGCSAFNAGIESYCDIGDPECCNGNPADYAIHLAYQKYDADGTAWVVQRWNELGNGGAVPSESASETSSTVPESTSEVVIPSSSEVIPSSVPTEAPTETITSTIVVPTESSTSEAPAPTSSMETTLRPVDPDNSAHAVFAPFSLASAAFVASLVFGAAILL